MKLQFEKPSSFDLSLEERRRSERQSRSSTGSEVSPDAEIPTCFVYLLSLCDLCLEC